MFCQLPSSIYNIILWKQLILEEHITGRDPPGSVKSSHFCLKYPLQKSYLKLEDCDRCAKEVFVTCSDRAEYLREDFLLVKPHHCCSLELCSIQFPLCLLEKVETKPLWSEKLHWSVSWGETGDDVLNKCNSRNGITSPQYTTFAPHCNATSSTLPGLKALHFCILAKPQLPKSNGSFHREVSNL